MDTLNALDEVSRELRLMAHYLSMVASRDAQAGEDARMFAQQLTELQLRISHSVQTHPKALELENAS